MSAPYRTGTVAATNGSTAVTGSLTAFLMNVKPGDLWVPDADGKAYAITAVNDNTGLEIIPAYAGSSGGGKTYSIARTSTAWNSVSEIGVSLAEIFATARDIRTSTGVPDNTLGVDGDVCFRLDAPEYYRKDSGAWVLVTDLIGPPGPGGPSYQATSTSPVAIGTGNKTFTVEAGRGYSTNQWLRVSHDAANYMEGTVTSYSGTTLVINVPASRAIGSGTYSSWNVNIAGDVGPANSLVVGSVTTGPAGSSASASITGTAPSQTLNLTIPRGNTGPANSLSIGTVTEGPAGATITGSAPTQTLNLVIPKGDAATVGIGAVDTVNPGDPATVTNSGTPNAAILNFGIPQGAPGSVGATGPNTGLDYQWDTGTADSDPGNGDVRVNTSDWGAATYVFISKTGRNGEALAAVIAALCGANNPHRAHVRIFPVASKAIYLEADVESAIVDGGNYWKLPLTNISASPSMPSASAVICVNIDRSGEAAASGTDAVVHALFGGL